MIRVLPVFVLAWLAVLLVLAVSVATRGGVRHGDARRYKPRSTHRTAGTRFDDAPPDDAGDGAQASDHDAPTDFFTGAALDPGGPIVRCDDCRALYHPDTVAMLAEHNGGRCASCGGTALHPLGRRAGRRDARSGPGRERALVPEPSSAEGYAAALGRLVTVEADVLRALPGPAAGAPGLLVRDAHGIELRLAFVGEAAVGRRGRARALGLLGARVRVRGLLLRDEAHGLKLLAIDPSMVREAAA